MVEENILKIYENINTTISKLNKYGFPYQLKNYLTGHFLVWDSDGRHHQYIASENIILGRNEKGINDFIRILRGEI